MAVDALKAGIAAYLIEHLNRLASFVPDDDRHTAVPEDPLDEAMAKLNGLGIVDIEVHDTGKLNSVVRIRTRRQGVRYFEVRVSEPI